jgi:hypothetical protein
VLGNNTAVPNWTLLPLLILRKTLRTIYGIFVGVNLLKGPLGRQKSRRKNSLKLFFYVAKLRSQLNKLRTMSSCML